MLENMVELVGLEPTTSSLRTMRSARKPQFGVHLAADYGSKRSNSDRLAGSCLTTVQENPKKKQLGFLTFFYPYVDLQLWEAVNHV